MKKSFNKIAVIILSLLLIVMALPLSVTAAGGIDVELLGVNVTATEGTIGAGAAVIGEDYTTVLTAKDGYEIFYVMVYGIGSAPDDVYHPDFEFDYETGVLTVSKSEFYSINCLEINVVAGRSLNYETDITTVSDFPYSDEYKLEEADVLKDFGYATKFFKVDLALGEALSIKFYGTDNEDADSHIEIYTYSEENGLEYETGFDHDRLGMGENAVFIPENPDTYYVATMCYDYYIGENYALELSVIENATALPNFIEEGHKNLSGHLWKWDAGTKTLTLEHAFETTNYAGDGISLPAGSTVYVNRGDAYINAEGYGIYCEGELNIHVKYGSLNIDSVYDAIVTEKGDINITADSDNDGSLGEINATAPYGIYIYEQGNINIDNCKINMECAFDGITACCGDINITDSDITILSDEGYGIVSFDPMLPEIGNVNISGGRLQIVSFGPTLLAESGLVTLEDVALFLFVYDDTTVIGSYYAEEFSIPGHFSMLDKNGKYIVENQEWSEDYLRPLGGVFNPDGSVTRASAIVTVAHAEKNNVVSGVKEEYTQDTSICVTVDSEVLEYPVMGNTSWFPTGWRIAGTDIEGIFYSCWVSILTNQLELGEYVLEVTFEKRVYFGDEWYYDGENTEVIPIAFTVVERVEEDEDITPTPTPTPGGGTDSDLDNEDDLYDPDVVPNPDYDDQNKENVEDPEIPDTRFESNATAFAVVSLTVAGVLALTFKRKKR